MALPAINNFIWEYFLPTFKNISVAIFKDGIIFFFKFSLVIFWYQSPYPYLLGIIYSFEMHHNIYWSLSSAKWILNYSEADFNWVTIWTPPSFPTYVHTFTNDYCSSTWYKLIPVLMIHHKQKPAECVLLWSLQYSVETNIEQMT